MGNCQKIFRLSLETQPQIEYFFKETHARNSERFLLIFLLQESFQMLYSAMALHAVKANGADVFVMSNNRVFHDTTSECF